MNHRWYPNDPCGQGVDDDDDEFITCNRPILCDFLLCAIMIAIVIIVIIIVVFVQVHICIVVLSVYHLYQGQVARQAFVP